MSDDDDDRPDLPPDGEIDLLLASWLQHPFDLHPAYLRVLFERFRALIRAKGELEAELEASRPPKRGAPPRHKQIADVVRQHLWNGRCSLMESKRRAARELNMTFSAVDQAWRRNGRLHGFGCDFDGNPLDPNHPWNKPRRSRQK